MPFHIMVTPEHDPPYILPSHIDGLPLAFDTGQDAADYCRNNSRPGLKLRPQAVLNDGWRDRERARFASGEYIPLPWSNEPWWVAFLATPIGAMHFAHVSNRDKEKIAYTLSEENGAADRQVLARPGRYLASFLPDLDSDTVRDYATKYSALYETNGLLFATTADEIEQVYRNGPRSCMSAGPSKFHSPFHPVRIYAAGDLQVAYIRRDGDITARTLVWPAKLYYGRLYGDENRLAALLEAAGYNEGDFDGARLMRHECNGGFVAPYLDNVQTVRDEGDFLIIDSDGDIECGSEYGVVEEQSRYSCDDCGDRIGEEETYHTEEGDHTYCRDCYNSLYTTCDRTGVAIDRDDAITMHNGDDWSQAAFERYGAQCEATGDNYPLDDIIVLEDGTTWCQAHFDRHGFICEATGQAHDRENMVTIDGRQLCPDAADAIRDDMADAPIPAAPDTLQLDFGLVWHEAA